MANGGRVIEAMAKAKPGDGAGKRSRAASRKAKPARRTRGTGAAYVYDSLKARILDLALTPGTLLDETLVSQQFGVSRSPVREALIRLSAEGLVQNLRNRTSIVAQFDIAALPAYFDAMQLLYRLSARLAAGNLSAGRVERLHQIVHEHEAALHVGDMRAMIDRNRDFHTTVAEMTGNPFIVNWMTGLLDQGQRVLRLYARNLGDQLPDDVLKPHRDLVAAIASGDADRAEEAGRADAQVLIEEFKRNLSNRPASQIQLHAIPLKHAADP
jgi:DNA-binding GntR family transcriptional regulator